MVTERIVVVGAGGMARCVLDLVDAINLDQSVFGSPRFEVVGVVADPPPDEANAAPFDARGVRYLGGVDSIGDLDPAVGYTIGIGSSQARRAIADRLVDRSSPVLIHPNAHIGHGVEIGAGSVICSHVSIENNVTLGRHVHVNQNATIGHDSRLADYVTVSPLTAISGNVHAHPAVFLGTGSAVREKTIIGQDAVVGMGAVVLNDVASASTVVGNPARSIDEQPA